MWKKFKHFGSFWLLAKGKKFIKFAPEKIIVNQSSLSIRQAQVKDISAILLLEKVFIRVNNRGIQWLFILK